MLIKLGGKCRQRYSMNKCKNTVIEVEMPERAPESGVDAGVRRVKLLCSDRGSIWLCTEDAQWAVTYLRDQVEAKEVAHVAGDDRGPGAKPTVQVAGPSTAENPEPVQQSSPPTSSSSAGVHGHTTAAGSNRLPGDPHETSKSPGNV